MLVITRKIGEALVIGGNITITVVESREGRVRIGIDAPKEIRVHRKEVSERIARERKEKEDAAESHEAKP